MTIVAEEWRPLADEYSGFNYEVSQLGRVRNATSKRVLRQKTTRCGYRSLVLYCTGRPRKYVNVHRLVATSFVDGRACGLEVNHIDGNKQNNCAENLEWVTKSRNSSHAWELGLQKVTPAILRSRRQLAIQGKLNAQAMKCLSDEQATFARRACNRGVSQQFVARWLGVSQRTISRVTRHVGY